MRGLVLLLLSASWAHADELVIDVAGVTAEAAENVRAQLGGGWVSGGVLSSERRRKQFARRAETEAVIALRPFGYYQAQAEASLVREDEENWRLAILLEPGPPMLIETVDLSIDGEGADHAPVQAWVSAFPLSAGDRLDQTRWEAQKVALEDVFEEEGFFLAEVRERRIDLDLERNRATLVLHMDTGPRAVLGTVRYEQDFLDERVVQPVPRFASGAAYRGWLVEQLRSDLWKLGFFSNVTVTETRDLAASPPRVDLVATLVESHRNTHQGTIGYGTDTEFRMQYRWQRHLLSERGDSLAAGFGWQTRNEELLLFGEYRLPRKVKRQEYWLFNPILTQEDQVFELDIEGREEKLPIAEGRAVDYYGRIGRVRVRNPEFSREQILETIFAQFISEQNDFSLIVEGIEPGDLPVEDLIPEGRVRSLSVGMDWDWPVIVGQGFDLTGHRERAWLFTSNEAWGSDVDYTQAYLSSRWTFRAGDDWRILLRGEIGYSDAEVREFTFSEDDLAFRVSLTELPFQFRFKAGGSYSVRGYSYESLSNNGLGSNNVMTASVEVERRVVDDWSVAAFMDAGNAFNDWSDRRLRKGVGVGVRWYAIGFPLRIDVASALDLDGEPWRVHFTIGSTLF